MLSKCMPEMEDAYWLRAIRRAWAKVEVRHSGCWEWVARRNACGYGTLKVCGKSVLAHRFMYSTAHELTPGLTLDHRCGNRACVNPAHMEQVTQAENFSRVDFTQFGAHESAKTHCPQGHEYTQSNTYHSKGGSRHCRTCHKLRERKRRAANRTRRQQ